MTPYTLAEAQISKETDDSVFGMNEYSSTHLRKTASPHILCQSVIHRPMPLIQLFPFLQQLNFINEENAVSSVLTLH
jgi:hypothetical protein